MTIVEEVLGKRENAYAVWRDDGDEELVRTTCVRQTRNGAEVFVMMDGKGRIMYELSDFLTRDLMRDAKNTATIAVCAMKALSNFCQIIRLPFDEFQEEHARAYLQFLRGTLGEGASYAFRLETYRSERTVSAYLNFARRYAKRTGVANSPFLEKRSVFMRGGMGADYGMVSVHAIKANVVEPKEAPRYVSKEDFKAVVDEIDRNWGIEERCIVRLMYEHGLRIGEVLGLTTEDIEWRTDSYGLPVCSVVLRNRVSDEYFQMAKCLKPVRDRREYRSPDYMTEDVGYQRVYISKSLYFDITDCMEELLPDFDPSCPSRADSVKKERKEKGNQYVFVNRRGKPLRQGTWNERLRRIMTAAGLHVDKGCRRTNLSHRFRHGYAMFLSHEAKIDGEPLDGWKVMRLMRHRSLSSTEIYQRPTAEDIAWLQREVLTPQQEALYGHVD